MKTRDDLVFAELMKEKPGRILDIAYAHNPNASLAKTGAQIDVVDPLARPAPHATMHQLDPNVTALPFADGTFDAVVMGCVLPHLSRPLALLREVRRVLRPGGLLIVSALNPNYYWENVINIFYHRFKKRVAKSKHEEHFFEFTRYAMRASFDRCGFTVEKEIGSTFYLVKIGLRLNVERFPGLGFEVVYCARKAHEPRTYTAIEDVNGHIVHLETDLFN